MRAEFEGDYVVEERFPTDQTSGVLAASNSEVGTDSPRPAAAEGAPFAREEDEQGRPKEAVAGTPTANSTEGQKEKRDLEIEDIKPEDYAASMLELREGEIVRGVVVQVDADGVMVDVRTKSEGIIPRAEVDALGEEALQVGQEIDVYIVRIEDEEGNLIVSKQKADYEKGWQNIVDAQETGEIIKATVEESVRGGLIVNLGTYGQGFVPASHVSARRPRNLSKYVGQTLPLRVIEVDRKRKRVVLSHRLVLEEEKKRQREETLRSLAEGQIREGVVRRLTDFGAFVDLGGIDGLLHVSEMAWTRVNQPSEMLRVGDKIQVMILKLNLEENRISLGRRQLLPDPWREVPRLFHEGEIVRGRVTRTGPFGAFVQLPNGIEGLVQMSELAERRVGNAEEVVTVGQEVEVKILQIRAEDRRMALSLRQAAQDRERAEYQDFVQDKPERTRGTIGDRFANLLGGNATKDDR